MTESTNTVVESKKAESKMIFLTFLGNLLMKTVKSKASKMIGGSVVGGGGAMLVLIALVNAKDADIRKYVELKDSAVREVIELKHQIVMAKIGQLDTGQGKILAAFEKLDQKMYEAALRANKKTK